MRSAVEVWQCSHPKQIRSLAELQGPLSAVDRVSTG